MNDSVRVTLIIVGFIIAGFGLGFMLEGLLQRTDSGAAPAGALLGLGLGLAAAAVTAGRR